MAENQATAWYDGEGLPLPSVGNENDYYLNVSNADIYKKMSNTWQRIGNIRGAQGIQGERGEQGEKGLKGDRGDTGPAGPQGNQGTIGKSGSIWYDGIGAPAITIGVVNDYYLDIYNGDIYKKQGATYWERVSSFLPDLKWFAEQVDEMVTTGYDTIESDHQTFLENMQNMADTFNTSQRNRQASFEASEASRSNTFNQASQDRANTFNNIVNTFNSNLSNMQTRFDNSMTLMDTEYLADKNNRDVTFTNDSNRYQSEFTEFINAKADEVEGRISALEDITSQKEILDSKTSVDGIVFETLQERLVYDFENSFPKYITMVDNLDNIIESGLYGIVNHVSAPNNTGIYVVFNLQSDMNNQTQLAFEFANKVTLFTRVKIASLWSSWSLGGLTAEQLAEFSNISGVDYNDTMNTINSNISKL